MGFGDSQNALPPPGLFSLAAQPSEPNDDVHIHLSTCIFLVCESSLPLLEHAYVGFQQVTIMNSLFYTFQTVSIVFAISAIITGSHAILDPVAFSRTFGLPIELIKNEVTVNSHLNNTKSNPITSYVSLMGVRQLATGITLLTFAFQRKWTEMATILSILGIVVAGTDGIYLSRSGAGNRAKLHAIPGVLIALLSGAVVLSNA